MQLQHQCGEAAAKKHRHGLPWLSFGGRGFVLILCLVRLLGWDRAVAVIPEVQPHDEAFPLVTQVAEFHQLAERGGPMICDLRLEGVVCSASVSQGVLVLQDDSGAEWLQFEMPVQAMEPGQRVRLTGRGAKVERTDHGFEIGKGLVVHNDGIHPMTEKSGAVFLTAGRHPVRLAWFNHEGTNGLEVQYEGPAIPRQKIPDTALFRLETNTTEGFSNYVHGLDYRCYEGAGWLFLPSAASLNAVKSGTAKNFDLNVRSRQDHVGLEFAGYLEVSRNGVYTFYVTSDDGSRLQVDGFPLSLEKLGTDPPPTPQRINIGQILSSTQKDRWSEVEGQVTFVGNEASGLELELASETGRMTVHVADGRGSSPLLLSKSRIRARGICRQTYTTDGQKVAGALLAPNLKEITVLEAPVESGAGKELLLSVLTRAEQVKRLKREEAQLGLPVRLRGVLTSGRPGHSGVVLQDSTWGVYVSDFVPAGSDVARIGDYWEIEGVTQPGDFAPVVSARRVTRLGSGRLPVPIYPTWDQLMSGSLDTQFVEIRGILVGVQTNGIRLLLREGRINLGLNGLNLETLKGYENTLVRLRGCLFPTWNAQTHQVNVGEMSLRDASMSVEALAPADPFASPVKSAAELLLFDAQAGAFQRVKVAGQILHEREGVYYMMDGTNGLRFVPKEATRLRVGDLVEAVGFPGLDAPSPVLREAVARRTGHADLPPARRLPSDQLFLNQYDSTRVRLEGQLVNLRNEGADQVLELQLGLRTWVARLPGGAEDGPSWPVGSRLELTGIYAGQGGTEIAGRHINSFELLLNGPEDITVLARPSGWNARHLWWLLGFLSTLFVATLGSVVVYSKRKVREQLKARREAEAQFAAVNRERNRLAGELHDTLEQSLTGVALQLDAGLMAFSPAPKEAYQHIEQARKMVDHSQGEVRRSVWDLRSQMLDNNDLSSALSAVVQQLSDKTGIRATMETAGRVRRLPERVEHHLLRIGQEALTNAVRHGKPRQIRVVLSFQPNAIQLSVRDDGRGFTVNDPAVYEPSHFGLRGMRERTKALGGRLQVESAPGCGATVVVEVPSLDKREPESAARSQSLTLNS